jgi:hypothetical protein
MSVGTRLRSLTTTAARGEAAQRDRRRVPERAPELSVVLDLDTPARPSDRPDRVVSRRWLLASVAGVAGALTLARGAPGSDATLAPRYAAGGGWGSFAGPVPGSDVYLLVALDAAGSAIAHACDGAGVAAWFTGRGSAGAVDLSAAGHRLVATVGPAGMVGSLTVGGRAHAFTLAPTHIGGGLFAARTAVADVTYRASWVVLDRRRQRGVLTVGRVSRPAPELVGSPVTAAGGVRLDPVRLDRFSRKWARLSLDGLPVR